MNPGTIEAGFRAAARWPLAALLLLALTAGCSTPTSSPQGSEPRGATESRTGAPHDFGAEGIFARHLRVRLAPSHTKRFEAILEACVAAARRKGLPGSHDWLAYREPPGRYWLIQFADAADGFAIPATLEGFVGHLGRTGSDREHDELMRRLAELEVEVEWEHLLRMKSAWSTVDEMNTATHPKARLIERTIRPGREADFDRALAARTAFLARSGYPLPVEGFTLPHVGSPRRAMQAVFPVAWGSFHESTSFFAFSKTLDEAGQAEYAERKADLLETMSCAEYYDASFVPELSYGASDD